MIQSTSGAEVSGERVTHIQEVIQPLIEHDVSSPTPVQLERVSSSQGLKRGMVVLFPPANGFHEASVVVDAERQVGISNGFSRILVKPVGQVNGRGIGLAAQQLQVQIAVLSYRKRVAWRVMLANA